VDGSGVGDVDQDIVRERDALGRNGVIMVRLDVDQRNGQLKGEPEITTRGFMLEEDFDSIHKGLKNRLRKTVKNANGSLERDVLNTVKSYIFAETKSNPYIFVATNRN